MRQRLALAVKNLLPVERYNETAILSLPEAEQHFRSGLGPPVPRVRGGSETLAEIARRRYGYFIRMARDNSACPGHQAVVRKAYFDVVRDSTLNACATTKEGYNLVGMNEGAIVNLHVFFYVLMSHPEVLPDYGFPHKEAARVASMFDCDWRAPLSVVQSRVALSQGATQLPQPRDPFRQSIADTLATMALDFVYFHELTHLRRGHLHYLKTETGAGKVDESWLGSAASESAAKQAFELDADGGAMEIALGPWLRNKSALGFQSNEGGPDEAVELWLFAVAFVFLLFDPSTAAVAAYRNQDHPHPIVRLMHLYVQGSHVAEQHRPGSRKRFEDAWWKALELAGNAAILFELPSAAMFAINRESMVEIIGERNRIALHLQQLVATHASLKL